MKILFTISIMSILLLSINASADYPWSKKKAKTKTPNQERPLGNLEGYYDIDKSHSSLVRRFKANKEFRISGLEEQFAKQVLEGDWRKRYYNMLYGLCPLAFSDIELFDEFKEELLQILKRNKIYGYIAIRGSSTTFTSIHPEKGRDPDVKFIQNHDSNFAQSKRNLHYFDSKVFLGGGSAAIEKRNNYDVYRLKNIYSDIDLNIKSAKLISKLKRSHAIRSPDSVGGNYNQDDTMNAISDLWGFKFKWETKLKRDISFVATPDSSNSNHYSKHPFTYKIQ